MVQFYHAFSSTLTGFSAPNIVSLNKVYAICNENAKRNGETNAVGWTEVHVEVVKIQTTSKSLNCLRLHYSWMNGVDSTMEEMEGGSSLPKM